MIINFKNLIKRVLVIFGLYELPENKIESRPELFNSSIYWDRRYQNGGNSGAGSYDHLAEFKAETINRFVDHRNIVSVIEFGFGDGNQLTLAKYPKYVGYDVSPKAIEICRRRFYGDSKKSFHHVSEWNGETAELVLSLDVIYHLVEDSVFDKYMEELFTASSKFVIIYSSDNNINETNQAIHVRHRNFTNWISINKPEWTLFENIKNRYPVTEFGDKGSFADFFIYHKINLET